MELYPEQKSKLWRHAHQKAQTLSTCLWGMSPLPTPGPARSPVSQIHGSPHLACVPPAGPQKSSWPLDCLCSLQSLPSRGNKIIERLFPAPQGFLGGKESACNAGDLGLIPGLGRCPGEGKGYLLHYSCLENPMDRGVWWAPVHGVAKSQIWLSN